jgi:esterase/lipase superfamily enzyme
MSEPDSSSRSSAGTEPTRISAEHARPADLSPGTLLGHTYGIEELLARGLVGDVYRARHVELGTEHAIKVLPQGLAEDPGIVQLFREEVRKLGRIDNDAIVDYQGFFRDERGLRFLVTEFVRGESLAELLRQRRLEPDEVLSLRDRLALGLAAAHEIGIVHREVSLENILLPEGSIDRAKLIGFRIAISTDPAAQTMIGRDFAGKYSYVSPEQIGLFGGRVDLRSDIYSLGLVLAAAAIGSGSKLEMGSSMPTMIAARQRIPDLSEVPASLRPIISPMLEPRPDDRPPSMRVLLRDQAEVSASAAARDADRERLRWSFSEYRAPRLPGALRSSKRGLGLWGARAASRTLHKSEYIVWYGTNRRPHDPANIANGYSSRRDATIHYGSCRVNIPGSHKIGSLGSPWWKRLFTWTDDRLRLIEISETSDAAFWDHLSTHLTGVRANDRHAVIFVHGYNVSFDDAALRAAQIGFDLSVKGTMAFFSWPSQGQLQGYMADEATIEASESIIGDFLVDFATRSGAEAVHIIAHSMGNRGVLRAVNRIADRARQRTGLPFGQIILAAADDDADTFRNLCAAYRQVSLRTTLYVSTRDRAVEASHWLHDFPRAGLMPPICVVPGIDTINVANVDLTLLGHGYVGAARDVLQDMYQLITHGSPPAKRFGLREGATEAGERFWVIGR